MCDVCVGLLNSSWFIVIVVTVVTFWMSIFAVARRVQTILECTLPRVLATRPPFCHVDLTSKNRVATLRSTAAAVLMDAIHMVVSEVEVLFTVLVTFMGNLLYLIVALES